MMGPQYKVYNYLHNKYIYKIPLTTWINIITIKINRKNLYLKILRKIINKNFNNNNNKTFKDNSNKKFKVKPKREVVLLDLFQVLNNSKILKLF